ncbi:MAG: hypothetical protein H6832_13625 [Planctomycetes bacterium]|nr:hypothetical protein [Planctomycetota bacterium]MCB9891304.1 hypothetical protein [Planctomycetota bacterium]MCB9919437.1 hypothetical protein [Planctomycetota bacterium]
MSFLSAQTFRALAAVLIATVRDTTRQRAFWVLVSSYGVLLVWWGLVIPWPTFTGISTSHDRALPGTWPLWILWVWLLRDLWVRSPVSAAHPLSRSSLERSVRSWGLVRLGVSAGLLLMAAIVLHVVVAWILQFHVEPHDLWVDLGLAIAGLLAISGLRRWIRSKRVVVVLAFVVLLLPALQRQRCEPGDCRDLVFAWLAIGVGLAISSEVRSDAIRDSW